jgi:hypothetical protein
MQGRDLIIKVLARFIEPAQGSTAPYCLEQGFIKYAIGGEISGDLEQIKGTPGIAIGDLGQPIA